MNETCDKCGGTMVPSEQFCNDENCSCQVEPDWVHQENFRSECPK